MKFTVALDRTIGRTVYRWHRHLYRWSDGRVGHRSPLGPILLLTTTGRRSGLSRTVPLLYCPLDGHLFIVGSNGGRRGDPAWLHNVREHPAVTLQVGRRHVAATATVLSPSARSARWPHLVAFYPGWSHYETLTDRVIEVVQLSPAPT